MYSRTITSIAVASALLGTAVFPLAASAEPMIPTSTLHPIFRLGDLPRGGRSASATPPRIYNGVRGVSTTSVRIVNGARGGTDIRPITVRRSFPQLGNSSTTFRRLPLNGSTSIATGTARARLAFEANIAREHLRVQALIEEHTAILQRFMIRMENSRASSTGAVRVALEEQMRNLDRFKQHLASSTASSTISSVAQSMADSYRSFAIVMGASAVTAAADRTNNIVSQMRELSTKLSARLASSTNPTATASLADFNAKVADAASLAQAALADISGVSITASSTTSFQAHEAALKSARTKLQEAERALIAARKDAGTIVRALLQASVSASATTTATTTQ